MSNYRIEQDSLGEIKVPKNKLWGAQTQRALQNFNISTEKMPIELIHALALIKKVASTINCNLGLLSVEYSNAINIAVDEILSNKYNNEFPLVIWQTGSGTQTNMNINEVLANLATEIIGGKRGSQRIIHANDHVNKSQSSNDVFPTAMHIAAVLALSNKLIPNIIILKNTFQKKSEKFKNIIKIGRTHLQDATPLTLGQEISGWVSMLDHNLNNINNNMYNLFELAMGGTAVGTGLNSPPEYGKKFADLLTKITNKPFITSNNKFESLSTCDALVNMHGNLKGLACSLMKIANDIRWLSSGPRCGLGEIFIPANEPGSSIMPGKINPTQCESLTMISCQVMGNDVSINIGGASGNFQLNVFRPMIIYNFLQSVNLLSDGIKSFNDKCAVGIEPNEDRIKELLNKSLMLVTALNNHIGYDKSAQIAKKAYNEGTALKEAALKLGYLTEEQFDEWIQYKNMV